MHEETTGSRTAYRGRYLRLDILDVRIEDAKTLAIWTRFIAGKGAASA